MASWSLGVWLLALGQQPTGTLRLYAVGDINLGQLAAQERLLASDTLYPFRDLLAILAAESRRARCLVVGEDLGTVADGVREELGRRGMLRYQVLLFEDAPPEAWAERALASVTTHDLPTVAGLMTGSDEAMLRAIGMDADDTWSTDMRCRLAARAGIDPAASPAEATVAIHRHIAAVRSAIVVAQLEDALAVEERVNVPGTTHKVRANWSLALPRPLDEVVDDPLVRAVADALREDRQAPVSR